MLLISLFDGIALHWAVDPEATEFSALAGPTADLLGRFAAELSSSSPITKPLASRS